MSGQVNSIVLISRSLSHLILLLPVVAGSLFGQQISTETVGSPLAHWTKAPTEFRGVRFGATSSEAGEVLGRLKCDKAAHDVPNAERCWTTENAKAFKVADRVVTTYYFFHEDRFVGVELSQSAPLVYNSSFQSFYGPLRLSFEEKFGPPTSVAGQGSEWTNEAIRVYIAPRMEQILTPYGDRISVQLLGTASLETQAWVKAQRDTQAKKVSPF